MNIRLAINGAAEPPPLRDVWLLVWNAQGNTVDSDCLINRGAPEPGDYAILQPGKEISRGFTLDCFDLDPTQDYRV